MTLQKPKFCGQNWLDMKPTKNGRICSGCQKVIVDFSKKSFNEIKEIQAANNNSICGMYSKNLINNWDSKKVIPNYATKALIAASTLIATSGPLISQNSTITNNRTENISLEFDSNKSISNNINDSIYSIIKGLITTVDEDGKTAVLPNVSILLKAHNIKTHTDSDGNYEIIIKENEYQKDEESLLITLEDYQGRKIMFDSIPKGTTIMNSELITLINSSISFYVEEPTKWQKFKWRIKNLFSKNEG